MSKSVVTKWMLCAACVAGRHTRCHYVRAKYKVWHRICFPVLHSVYSLWLCVTPAIRIVLAKLFVKYKAKCLRLFNWICIKFESMGKDEKVFLSCTPSSVRGTVLFPWTAFKTNKSLSLHQIFLINGKKKVEKNKLRGDGDDGWTQTWSTMLAIDKIFIIFEIRIMKWCCRHSATYFIDFYSFAFALPTLHSKIKVGKPREINRYRLAGRRPLLTPMPLTWLLRPQTVAIVYFSKSK